jgi:hypothetical protein
MKNRLALLALAMLAQGGWATQLQVDVLVMPAWLERGAVTRPLLPGVVLQAGDVIRTGAGARAYLQMSDGAQIRLGEQTRLHIAALDAKPRVSNVSLGMLQGALRLGSPQVARDIGVRVVDLDVVLRQGDVWAKSSASADMLGLVEGSAAISHQTQQLQLSETMTYVHAERKQSLSPVRGFNLDQLQKWSGETEILEGQGVAISGGPVSLLLGEFSVQADALALYDQLRQNGYPARLQPLGRGERLRYRVRITDFADTDDARATLQRLRQQLNTPLGDIRTR